MTKYSFILLNGQQDALLDRIRELGLVDVTRSEKPVDSRSQDILDRARRLSSLKERFLRFRALPDAAPLPVEGSIETLGPVLLDREDALKADERSADADIRLREPWGSFSAEKLDCITELGYQIRYYTCPAKSFQDRWAEKYPLQVVSRKDGKVWFVTVVPPEQQSKYFLPAQELPAPGGDSSAARARLEALRKERLTVQGQLLTLKEQLPDLESACRKALSDLEVYLAGAARGEAAEGKIVTLVGFAPTERDAEVTQALDLTGAFYLKEAARAKDNPPISFRNNKFVKMFETLTDMYGRPSYDGFDPTPFISIFFLLFFAFCMGDAGYGLVLVLAGLLLRKKVGDLAPLVITLGIGTMVIGFLFHTFFSMDISTWKVFEPIKGIFLPGQIAGNDATMVLSLVVGILHICLAMVVKALHQTKTKGFLASLGTWGWTLLIVGGIIVAAFAFAGVLNATLTKWIVIVLGVVSALGIFVFNDPKRNKFANIGMGLWDTYNMITGLVGDVLSYIRLYALGLAGSMLGMAFNDMGVMILGDTPNLGKWIGFMALVIFGHTLNIAMCALGAFVHPLRLNFLEFFKNAGYEASGRNYNPLKK